MPDRQHEDICVMHNVVEVIPRAWQQDPTRTCNRRLPIRVANLRCVADDGERGLEFVEK